MNCDLGFSTAYLIGLGIGAALLTVVALLWPRTGSKGVR